jgi:hypothetical protein
MTGEDIEFRVVLSADSVEPLLDGLDQRLKFLQRVQHSDGEATFLAAQREKSGVIAIMMAIEAVLRAKSRAEH